MFELICVTHRGLCADDLPQRVAALCRGGVSKVILREKDLSEEERLDKMAQYGLSVNIPKMKADLRRYQIEYDEWFLESALHNSGYVAETVGLLADKGYLESVYRAGAEKASYVAEKTLRKVYKKVGFLAR